MRIFSCMILMAAVSAPAAAMQQDVVHTAAEAKQVIEAEFRSSGSWPFFETIRRYYPKDYDKIMDRIIKQAQRDDNPDAAQTTEVNRLMARKMKAFRAAPTENIRTVNRLKLDFLRRTQRENVTLCAQYMGAGIQGEISPKDEAALARIAAAVVEAAAAGEGRPLPKARKKMQDEDAIAFVEQMLAIDPTLEKYMENENGPAGASAADQCRYNVALVTAMDRLPPDQGANVIAEIVAEEWSGGR